MRDIFVILIVFGSLAFIVRQPYIGVLVWSWISYMNPHKLAWGFAREFPFAYIVAIALFISVLIHRNQLQKIPPTGLVKLWGIYLFWMCVTTLFAIYPEAAAGQLLKIFKIQLITLLTIMIMTSRKRIELLIWIIVLSIGFYGIKGGIFTVLTGGVSRVWGPPGGFIQENNSLALALLMIFPLIYYLRLQTQHKWLRLGLLGSMPIIAISIFGSQSRGALIGIVSMALFMALKSKKKALAVSTMFLILVFGFVFMPQSWYDRMGTIQEYEQDHSAMGRINAWHYSFNVANDRITGAGLESWSRFTFAQYAPDPSHVQAAHSIYFSVLGDHGWIGLLLWVSILIAAWRSNSWIITNARSHDHLRWAVDLAKMLQVSMVSYGTAGAFLSLAYFDLPWHIIAIITIVQGIVKKSVEDKLRSNTLSTGKIVGRLNP